MTDIDADLRERRENVIQKHIQAVWTQDFEAFEATYVPGKVCYDYPQIGRTLDPTETREHLFGIGGHLIDREVVFQRFYHSDDDVIIETCLKTRRRDVTGELLDESPITSTSLTIYRFAGELLWQKSLYPDPQFSASWPKA